MEAKELIKDQLNPKEFERWARIGVDQDGIKYMPIAGIFICGRIGRRSVRWREAILSRKD